MISPYNLIFLILSGFTILHPGLVEFILILLLIYNVYVSILSI